MNEFDFDPYRLAPLKPSCARIITDRTEGTGFAIGGSRVLTCAHVVKDVPILGPLVNCIFGAQRKSVACRVLSRDDASDVAILGPTGNELDQTPVPSLVATTPKFMNWWAWGFPAFTNGQGMPLFGYLADPAYKDREGRECFQLFAAALVGEDAQLGGFSGSPVLTSTNVVGMIDRVLGIPGDGKRTRLGFIYAIPIAETHWAFRANGDSDGIRSMSSPIDSPQEVDTQPNSIEIEQLGLFGELFSASTADGIMGALNKWEKVAPVPKNVPLIAAEKILGMGAARLALQVLDANDTTRAKELRALAFSLLREHDKAHSIISALPVSAESGGIAGGILKRRYLESQNEIWLRGAFDQYDRLYEVTKDPYPGINAAATALWLGDMELSRTRAEEVAAIVKLKPEYKRDHWDWATLGEAHLLCGAIELAKKCYQKAVSLASFLARDISVMRKQVRISLRALDKSESLFEDILVVGGIACFSGHRVDEPNRLKRRFPRERVTAVESQIRYEIEKHNIKFGFSSAAGGADLLFIEQLLAIGGEPSVFLPFPQDEFSKTSVGPEWQQRFEDAIRRIPTANLHVLSDKKPQEPGDEANAYAKCNEEIQRATLELGQIYDEKPIMITVLNAERALVEASTRGGTAEAVQTWERRLNGPVILIDPMK